jgi:hypothetical protein
MKIPPAHEFIQFRDFPTRLKFALDEEMKDELISQVDEGWPLFRRLVDQYRMAEGRIQGRPTRRARWAG